MVIFNSYVKLPEGKGKIYKNNGIFLGFTINIHQLQGFPLHGSLIILDPIRY